ncbi:hypothetical protein [Brevundimonas subvibrioides]|uniref:hypothetical protein n=1 Tax=Brevundimonas subvibrioides TaxID=74313 RepID=UPI0032D5AA59
MNVEELSTFSSADQFLAHATGLPRVILEGQSDVILFKVWFQELQEDLEFVAAEDVVNGGGCTAVGPAVDESVIQSIPAVGVVDRDYLQREKRWDILFATDPAMLAGSAGHPDVRVASLWEIEAYLLRPELLGSWVGVQHSPQPAPARAVQRATEMVLQECEGLLDAVAFFASGHECGVPYDERYFLADRANTIGERCRALLGADTKARQEHAAAIEEHLGNVRDGRPEDPAERIVYLLQFIDTKRLLHRLRKRLSLGAEAHHALKVLMADRGLRPEELHQVLTDAVRAFTD